MGQITILWYTPCNVRPPQLMHPHITMTHVISLSPQTRSANICIYPCTYLHETCTSLSGAIGYLSILKMNNVLKGTEAGLPKKSFVRCVRTTSGSCRRLREWHRWGVDVEVEEQPEGAKAHLWWCWDDRITWRCKGRLRARRNRGEWQDVGLWVDQENIPETEEWCWANGLRCSACGCMWSDYLGTEVISQLWWMWECVMVWVKRGKGVKDFFLFLKLGYMYSPPPSPKKCRDSLSPCSKCSTPPAENVNFFNFLKFWHRENRTKFS